MNSISKFCATSETEIVPTIRIETTSVEIDNGCIAVVTVKQEN